MEEESRERSLDQSLWRRVGEDAGDGDSEHRNSGKLISKKESGCSYPDQQPRVLSACLLWGKLPEACLVPADLPPHLKEARPDTVPQHLDVSAELMSAVPREAEPRGFRWCLPAAPPAPGPHPTRLTFV